MKVCLALLMGCLVIIECSTILRNHAAKGAKDLAILYVCVVELESVALVLPILIALERNNYEALKLYKIVIIVYNAMDNISASLAYDMIEFTFKVYALYWLDMPTKHKFFLLISAAFLL